MTALVWNWGTRLTGLAGVALLGVMWWGMAGVPSAPAQTTPPPTPTSRTVQVTGEAEATAPPDVVYLSVGVQTLGEQAADATAENSRVMAAVVEVFRARGVRPEDLRTSSLIIWPQYDRTRTSEVTGYQVVNDLRAAVHDVGRASELLDAALAAGANRLNGVAFGLRDDQPLREQALTAAGLGARVVAVRTAQEEVGAYYAPARAMPEVPVIPGYQGSIVQPPQPPVESGEQRVTARVLAIFQIE